MCLTSTLFRRLPYDLGPAEGKKELLCELEERAALVEQLDPQQRAEMRAIRSMIHDCEAAGLFSEAPFSQKERDCLKKYPTLLTYHKAAIDFLK